MDNWKTCFACDATYQGEVCGHCLAQSNYGAKAVEPRCPHGFLPSDGCFACMGVDMFAWVTPAHMAVVNREARTGDIPDNA